MLFGSLGFLFVYDKNFAHTYKLFDRYILHSKFKKGIANHNNFLLMHLTITVTEVLRTVTAYWDVTPCTIVFMY
jgi:hypothetical protein